jgi:small subunit ribosomal protein S6
MRVYEELFILKPDTSPEDVDVFVEQIHQVITNGKGTVDKTDKWGVRKLAYRVNKFNEGCYVLIQFTSTPDLVHEVERRLRVADVVIKFITVRIDEKLKKIEKRKKSRDKRAARKPPPQIATPLIPTAPAMPAEAHVAAPGLPGAPAADAPVETPAVAVETPVEATVAAPEETKEA